MRVLLLLTLLSIITYPIPSIRIGEQPLAIFLVAYLVLYFICMRGYRRIAPSTFWPLGLFLVGFIVSSLVSGTFNTAYALNLLVFYLIFFVYANIGRTVVGKYNPDATIHRCLSMLVLSGVLLCAYGFYGYITGNVGDEPSSFWWSSAKYWGIHYTEATRNADVHYIVFPLIALIVSEKKKIYHWVAITMLGSAVLLSMARNTWLCLIVVILVHALLGNDVKKSLKLFLLGIGGFFGAVFLLQHFGVLDYFMQKVLSIFNRSTGISNSNGQRFNTILVTLETILTHPLGVGANQMYKYFHDAGIWLNHAENTYLNITAELGIVAAISYTYIVINPLKRVIVKYKRLREISAEERYVLLASLYMATTMLFNTETINCYMWIIIGLHWFILAALSIDKPAEGADI